MVYDGRECLLSGELARFARQGLKVVTMVLQIG